MQHLRQPLHAVIIGIALAMFYTAMPIATATTTWQNGQEGRRGFSIEVSADEKVVSTLFFTPPTTKPGDAAGSSPSTFSIIPVPSGEEAKTPEGDPIAGFKLTPQLEGEGVRIEITAMIGKLGNITSDDKEKAGTEKVVASYLVTAGDTVNVTETEKYGLKALTLKVTSVDSAQLP